MPDISKCANENCKDKLKCWRYTSEPSEYQSYGIFMPDKNKVCDYFWPTEEEDVR